MIYFIQAGDNGPIKIGASSSPREHVKILQQGNHQELNLIAQIPGDRSLEQKVRADLEEFERGRKWFDATDEVLDYIEKIQVVEYDIVNEVALAILWRDREDSETDHCPFCGERHRHEGTDGRYEVDCLSRRLDGLLTVERTVEEIILKQTILRQRDGYIIRTRAKNSALN